MAASSEVLRPRREALLHKDWCRSHGLLGRIWVARGIFGPCGAQVSRRGINVQVSGPPATCRAYADFVAGRFRGRSLLARMDPVSHVAFGSLRVKAKKLVSLNEEPLGAFLELLPCRSEAQ